MNKHIIGIRKIFLYCLINFITILITYVGILFDKIYYKNIIYLLAIIFVNTYCLIRIWKCLSYYKKSYDIAQNSININNMKRLFREQRHDYMNYIQIIYGYLQIGRIDKAIGEVGNVIAMNSNISKMYNLSILSISLFIDKWYKIFSNADIKVFYSIKNLTDFEIRVVDNDKEIIQNLDYIFNDIYEEFQEESSGEIGLDITEFEEGINFVFRIDINKFSFEKLATKFSFVRNNNGELNIYFNFVNPMPMDDGKTAYSLV